MFSKRLLWLAVVVTLLLLLQPSPQPAHSQDPDVTTYLLWLAPPAGDPPAGMPAQLLPGFYLPQVHEHIAHVSSFLETLKAKGRIVAFTPLPEANAVEVEVPDEGDQFMLKVLPQVVKVTPVDATQVAEARQALTGVWKPFVAAQGGISPQATNPSIFVNETWDDVHGWTEANAYVTVVLKDSGGGIKDTQYTTADYDDGYYYAYFYYSVDPGDVVEVTADSNFASLTVDTLTGRVDRVNDRVTGTAPAGRTMYDSV